MNLVLEPLNFLWEDVYLAIAGTFRYIEYFEAQ